MKMQRTSRLLITSLFTLGFFFWTAVIGWSAEQYPAKAITIVVTHAAGSANDKPPRLIQPYLSKALGVPILIDNMAGAGGSVARAYVYKAAPDGYTLLASGQPSMSVGFATLSAAYDPLKFTPIYGLTGRGYNALAVPYDSPYKTVKQIIEASKSKAIPTGCAGLGGTGFLCIILLNLKHGSNLQYVPYEGAGDVIMAVAGNQIPMGLTTFTSWLPLVQQKKIRLIALAASERDDLAPDVPTLTELGYPGVETDDYRGIYGPPGMPQNKVDILAAAFSKATKDPAFVKAAATANETLKLQGPAEFGKEVRLTHQQVLEIAPALKAATMK